MTTFYLDPVDGCDSTIDAAAPKRLIWPVGTTRPAITAAQVKFGAYALDMASASANAALQTANDLRGGFQFGNGPFTVEAWVYFASHSATVNQVIAGNYASTSNLGWTFGTNASGQLVFGYSTTGTDAPAVGAAWTPPLNQWIHLAADRDAANVLRVYVNGAVLASATVAATLFASTRDLFIGNDGNLSRKFPGHIGGLRITKGVARYAGAFTPPAAAFPTSAATDPSWAQTVLCLNFDVCGDGLSFAGRVRTLTHGLPSSRLAAGDVVRVIASPDPAGIGNALWTDNSRVVTLDTACTQTIDSCDTAWTASANITTAASTTLRKQGTACALITPAAAFTTGKMAYRTLPAALDLSAYQQVSFWLRTDAGIAAGTYELRLCTDTLGEVDAHRIPMERATTGGSWVVVAADLGAPLSTAIRSVALYALLDPGTTAVRIDNIIACKSPAAPDALTHLSLIGKNTAGEPEWYPILSIDGTTVELGGGNDINLGTSGTLLPRPYRGASETVPTWRLQPLDAVNEFASLAPLSSAMRVLASSGAAGAPITFSGGWDRAGMSTQSGDSWLTGSHWASNFVDLSSRLHFAFERFGAAHFLATPVNGNSITAHGTFQFAGLVGNAHAFYMANANCAQSLVVDAGNVVHNGLGLYSYAVSTEGFVTMRARRVTGCYITTGHALSGAASRTFRHEFYVGRIDNHAGHGIGSYHTNNGKVIFYNPVIENVAGNDIAAGDCGDMLVINPTTLGTTAAPTKIGDTLRITNPNGDPADQRVYNGGYTFRTDTTVRRGTSGVSWKLSPTSTANITQNCQAEVPLARYLATAGIAKTFGCWVRRSHLDLNLGIRIKGGRIAGIATDQSAAATGPVDTWEQLTLTVTPTVTGVIELLGYAWGGATYDGWFDDLAVS